MPAPASGAPGRDRRRPLAVEPAWHPLPLAPDALAHYGRSLGFERPAAALEALARAIAANRWPASAAAVIVCRPSSRPPMAVWGRFSAGDAGALGAQARVLDSVCRHLRYVRYEEAAAATEELAARLLERLGRDRIRRARFAAVPRGGLVVLGLLAVMLRLEPEQLEAPGPTDELLVVVDDCALSGARSAQALARHGGRRVVFAHLYSHRSLRSAIEEREPRVVACLAGRELGERRDEPPAGWRRRWSERVGGQGYWIGRPETLCFPWGEPDRSVWNPIRERAERAWRVVPPELCFKNRPPAGGEPIPVQVQPQGGGGLRPADRVLWGDLGESVVLGNFASGESFVLQGIAADIWRQVARVGNLPSVVADLASEHPTSGPTLRRDVQAFVARLIDQGLLRDFDPEPAAGRAGPARRLP